MPTAMIADDEALLRHHLKAKLALLWPELEIIMEAEHGLHAQELISAAGDNLPDVVFLDIHMPGMTGLEVARLIGKRAHIVFVTAFNQYAIEAFERGAIDYLLKPFENARLSETILRLKERMQSPVSLPATVGLESMLSDLSKVLKLNAPSYLQWIKASVGNTVRLIPIDEVLYFHSDEKYTCVTMADGEALVRKPIKELLLELDPAHFWQIHRSTIVNARAVLGVVRGDRDQADLLLKGRSETLTVSRNYIHLFRQM
jgi:DNA-binding LytR/AlgR family response regulator